ncbi:hypothetical protein [Streptomyces scabiei]|uniref:hypothetical protein n=1 Tax=Streptomyces scabiei TaxID=1930 RepID=UPI000A6C2AC8|nr:hypothetical protein [Streptomyces scabiei]
MRRPRVQTWTGSAVAAVLLVTAQAGLSAVVGPSSTAVGPSTASSSTSAPAADARSASSLGTLQGQRFTLVTGDVVTVGTEKGEPRVDVEPGRGREVIGFVRRGSGAGLGVIPTGCAR